MKYTYIIWDFNGTLLNDVETGIKNVNTLLARRGKPLVDGVESYRNAFTFPITSYYENVGFDLTQESFDDIAVEWIAINQENIKKAPLYKDALYALEFFKNKNIPQSILSATERTLLCGHIEDLGITSYFDEIMGLDNIKAESKAGIALDWKNRHPNEVPLFIGDTLHDASVAQVIGCDCVLVATGHQTKKTLESSGLLVYDSLSEAINKGLSL